VAAVDPQDPVGGLDEHFPDARFFTEIERLVRCVVWTLQTIAARSQSSAEQLHEPVQLGFADTRIDGDG
jgi:hypothetical protein